MIRLTFYDARGELRDTRVVPGQRIEAAFEGSPIDSAISHAPGGNPVAHCNFRGDRMEITSEDAK